MVRFSPVGFPTTLSTARSPRLGPLINSLKAAAFPEPPRNHLSCQLARRTAKKLTDPENQPEDISLCALALRSPAPHHPQKLPSHSTSLPPTYRRSTSYPPWACTAPGNTGTCDRCSTASRYMRDFGSICSPLPGRGICNPCIELRWRGRRTSCTRAG